MVKVCVCTHLSACLLLSNSESKAYMYTVCMDKTLAICTCMYMYIIETHQTRQGNTTVPTETLPFLPFVSCPRWDSNHVTLLSRPVCMYMYMYMARRLASLVV